MSMTGNRPSPAGIYDYFLGGHHYSEADRAAAEEALAIAPEGRFAARENRAFLQRAVRYIAAQGVRQFIDIGSGYPTAGPVHEIAAEAVPDPRASRYSPSRPSRIAVAPCALPAGALGTDETADRQVPRLQDVRVRERERSCDDRGHQDDHEDRQYYPDEHAPEERDAHADHDHGEPDSLGAVSSFLGSDH